MEINHRQVSLRVLEAAEGHYIVRRDEDPATAHYAERVYLGSGDSPDNYREASADEYHRVMAAREAAQPAVEDAWCEEVIEYASEN